MFYFDKRNMSEHTDINRDKSFASLKGWFMIFWEVNASLQLVGQEKRKGDAMLSFNNDNDNDNE